MGLSPLPIGHLIRLFVVIMSMIANHSLIYQHLENGVPSIIWEFVLLNPPPPLPHSYQLYLQTCSAYFSSFAAESAPGKGESGVPQGLPAVAVFKELLMISASPLSQMSLGRVRSCLLFLILCQ